MCNFITTWISEPFDTGGLKSILKANDFGFHEYPDSPIKDKLRVPIYFRPGKGQCDCGSEIGGMDREPIQEASLEQKIALLRGKGWGEAKINRWIEERMRMAGKSARKREARKGEASEPIEKWRALVKSLLDGHGIKSVGILYHDYRGDQTDEDFELQPMVKLEFSSMTAEDFGNLKVDTPYEICMQSPRR